MIIFMYKNQPTYYIKGLDVSDLQEKKWNALTGKNSEGFRAYKAAYQLVIL